MGLVSTMAYDVESRTDSEDENEVYSKLTTYELIESVKELLSHFQTRSKELKELKEIYVSLLKLHERTCLEMVNIQDENIYFKPMTDKWSKKPLSEKYIALQEFIVSGIDRSKVNSIICTIYQNNGRGIDFTEGKPSETNPNSCSDYIKEDLKTYFMPEFGKTEEVIQLEHEAYDSKPVNISKSKNPKSKIVNNSKSKTPKIQILKRQEPKSQVLKNS